MQVLGKTLGETLQTVGRSEEGVAGTPRAVTTDIASIEKAQRALRVAARSLEAIRPPPRVAADHRLLLEGVREYAAELAPIVSRLRRGEPPYRVLATILTLRGLKDMQRASQEFAVAGYDIFG